MADKIIRVVVLDTEAESELDEELSVREIKDDLDEFYSIIGCDCVDIPTRKIGGEYYDIICDDEGVLKDYPQVAMVDKSLQPMIVGTIIISKSDEEGELVSLTDEDIDRIKNATLQLIDFTTGRLLTVIRGDF